jgi:hypothetical protein
LHRHMHVADLTRKLYRQRDNKYRLYLW